MGCTGTGKRGNAAPEGQGRRYVMGNNVRELLDIEWEDLINELIARSERQPDEGHSAKSTIDSLVWLRNTCLDREQPRNSIMSRPRIILSINAGSSSLKITLFHVDNSLNDGINASSVPEKIAACEVSGFTDPPAKEKYTRGSDTTKKELPNLKSHSDAFRHILNAFLDDKNIENVSRKEDITHACHRVVHGGDYATDQLIDQDTYHKIEKLEDLAPL